MLVFHSPYKNARSKLQKCKANFKRYKSSGIDQIKAISVQAGDKRARCEITTFVNSIRNKEKLSEEWMQSSLQQG
jgi:hypothetical protein